MKKHIIILLAAAAMLLTACSKNAPDEPAGGVEPYDSVPFYWD